MGLSVAWAVNPYANSEVMRAWALSWMRGVEGLFSGLGIPLGETRAVSVTGAESYRRWLAWYQPLARRYWWVPTTEWPEQTVVHVRIASDVLSWRQIAARARGAGADDRVVMWLLGQGDAEGIAQRDYENHSAVSFPRLGVRVSTSLFDRNANRWAWGGYKFMRAWWSRRARTITRWSHPFGSLPTAPRPLPTAPRPRAAEGLGGAGACPTGELLVRGNPRQRLAAFEQLGVRGALSPEVVTRARELALAPRGDLELAGNLELAGRIMRAVQALPYLPDGASVADRVRRPCRVLSVGGDCEDLAMLVASLDLAAGIDARLRWLSQPSADADHVSVQAFVGGRWLWQEPTVPALLGEHPFDAAKRLSAGAL